MARGNMSGNRPLVPSRALDQFKYEVARELGLDHLVDSGYWGDVPSRDCGAVGGQMVRKMIEMAEQQMANRNRL